MVPVLGIPISLLVGLGVGCAILFVIATPLEWFLSIGLTKADRYISTQVGNFFKRRRSP